MKKRVYLHFILLFLLASCSEVTNTPAAVDNNSYVLEGQAQGTTFQIKYFGENAIDLSEEVELILKEIDLSMSLWVTESQINKFNNTYLDSVVIDDPYNYFRDVFIDAKIVYHKTKGYFDPSIDPLIEFLGFGLKNNIELDFKEIDSVKALCQFDDESVHIKKSIENNSLTIQKRAHNKLNFNAIAQGYSVDVISNLLTEKGIENQYIEIGGELRVSGVNQHKLPWKIGIDRPTSGERVIDHTIQLDNKSLATSGSYRKFKEIDGKKYSHTINPITGMPVTHNLLSVSVLMPSCSQADAYATAFMAMGRQATLNFINNNPDLEIEVFLIYDQNSKLESYATSGFNVQKISE